MDRSEFDVLFACQTYNAPTVPRWVVNASIWNLHCFEVAKVFPSIATHDFGVAIGSQPETLCIVNQFTISQPSIRSVLP